jgi:hypothetical protein
MKGIPSDTDQQFHHIRRHALNKNIWSILNTEHFWKLQDPITRETKPSTVE